MSTSHDPHPIDVAAASYEIRFDQLTRSGRARAFPCDVHGTLASIAMTPQLQDNYCDAMARVGYDFAYPCVVPCGTAWPTAR